MSFPSSGRRLPLLIASALVCAIALTAAPAAFAAAGDTGRVHFMRGAESNFDGHTRSPTAAQQAWMRDHYSRMKTWAPYFDSRTKWYPNAWAYRDAYAIYRTSSQATAHPEWILKDAKGTKLYIPFGCGGGTCPQYAADIGNPTFRRAWIADARASLTAAYRGLYIDDVNMRWRVGNGTGQTVDAIDPRTGKAMTLAAWQRYMADFMQEVRAALPGREIVHNAIWFSNDNADVRRQLRAADVVGLERGFNDDGITNGTGQWSFRTFVALIERTHADGHAVLLDADAKTAAGRLYGLAAYFLVTSGRDFLGNATASTPTDWWKGYDVELGDALGKRYLSGGVWRRDFQRGTVLVNEPDEPTRTIAVGAGMRDLGGVRRTSVTLGPAAGAVLLRDGVGPPPAAGQPPAAPAPAAPPLPTAAPKPVPTAVGGHAPATVVAPAQRPTGAPGSPHSGAARDRMTVRVRVLAAASASARRGASRRVVRVSGVVHGARSGRVVVAVRSAAGRSGARLVLRIARSGRFARRLQLGAGRWRVRADYRAQPRSAVTASAVRSLTVRR